MSHGVSFVHAFLSRARVELHGETPCTTLRVEARMVRAFRSNGRKRPDTRGTNTRSFGSSEANDQARGRPRVSRSLSPRRSRCRRQVNGPDRAAHVRPQYSIRAIPNLAWFFFAKVRPRVREGEPAGEESHPTRRPELATSRRVRPAPPTTDGRSTKERAQDRERAPAVPFPRPPSRSTRGDRSRRLRRPGGRASLERGRCLSSSRTPMIDAENARVTERVDVEPVDPVEPRTISGCVKRRRECLSGSLRPSSSRSSSRLLPRSHLQPIAQVGQCSSSSCHVTPRSACAKASRLHGENRPGRVPRFRR